jgi:peptidoglycan-N-acetylglucosamine deacetylase
LNADCYLTFDDGPDPRSTPQVLEALAQVDASATFFVLGSLAARHPGIVEDTIAAGHRVEFHGHEHVGHDRLDRGEIERDLETGLAVLARIGVQPARWRPPYGATTDASFELAASYGLALTGWTSNPRDWAGSPAPEMLASLDRMLGPYAVVVLHDGIRDEGARGDARETVALLGPLVAELRLRGCEPRPLPDPGASSPALAVARSGAPWTPPGIQIQVLEEDEIDEAFRRRLGAFIADLYESSGPPYRERAWRTFPPVARIVALHEGELIGHAAHFRPRVEPSCPVGGMGDLAVARAFRGRGLARTLSRHLVFQGWRRGVHAQLVATETSRTTLARLGFEPVDTFAFHWEDAQGCHRHPLWMFAVAQPIPPRLRLLDPDF